MRSMISRFSNFYLGKAKDSEDDDEEEEKKNKPRPLIKPISLEMRLTNQVLFCHAIRLPESHPTTSRMAKYCTQIATNPGPTVSGHGSLFY